MTAATRKSKAGFRDIPNTTLDFNPRTVDTLLGVRNVVIRSANSSRRKGTKRQGIRTSTPRSRPYPMPSWPVLRATTTVI